MFRNDWFEKGNSVKPLLMLSRFQAPGRGGRRKQMPFGNWSVDIVLTLPTASSALGIQNRESISKSFWFFFKKNFSC
jgi:hypothetical protein